MSDHYYQHDYHHRRHRVVKRVKWFFVGLLISSPIIVAILFFTVPFFIKQETPAVTSNVQTSVQAPSIKIFRTPYFQFQAGKTWSEDAKETSANKYVYRSYRGPLIDHDLTIYINPPSQVLNATRIQPVEPQADGTFKVPEGISTHCQTALPEAEKKQEVSVTFKGVTFVCDGDDTLFDVLVGKVNGTPLMELIRPDGSTANYIIVYRDLTAEATGRELKEIVESFQTR